MTGRTILLSLAACCTAGEVRALEVHEWGTFTTFHSPTGTSLTWYVPGSDSIPLPGFVRHSPLSSKQGYSRIRMETPVIYFYPDQPMEVTVKASFQQGSITEVFPTAQPSWDSSTWQIKLLPPDDVSAAKRIPACEPGEIGAHYAAARAVPDAWIVSSKFTAPPLEGKAPETIEEYERFIFYRGVGNSDSGLSLWMPEADRVLLRNSTSFVFPHQVVLRADGGMAAWSTVQEAAPANSANSMLTIVVPSADRPVTDVTDELVSHFQKRLADDGLSDAEAAAMVATWRETWFQESGIRVFSIMPQGLVDQMLPLEITPKPKTLRRVFVLRSELADPSKVSLLTDFLWHGEADADEMAKTYRDLGMGRFADGMRLASIEQAQRRMTGNFFRMRQTAAAVVK
jgi:hypothetical protein